MNLVLRNAQLWQDGRFEGRDIAIREGRLQEMAAPGSLAGPTEGIDCSRLHVFPGFTDAHVHLREPGFSYKERMETGTLAGARGGYTRLISMPNLNPMPDSLAGLQAQLDIIHQQARVAVLPLGTITRGEAGRQLADMGAMAPYVPGFSDDGRGVQQDALMKQAMLEAKALGRVIVAHCEDESLVAGGVIHQGHYAQRHGLPGNPSVSEWRQLERDIALLRDTGAAYHACHLSTKESVALVRKAKRERLDISCETAPHYLLMHDQMLADHGRFKMNPPIRSEEDRQALLEGLRDGTVDMVATDHAPHSAEEKAGGLLNSMNGVVGLETAFPLLYHHLVLPGLLPLHRLVDALHHRPNQRFGLPLGMPLGQPVSLSLWNLSATYAVDSADFLSLGKATPFEGWPLTGRCLMTIAQGRLAYREGI